MPTFSFLCRSTAALFSASLAVACGGDVVVDAPSADDGPTSSSGASSSSTGPGGGRTCEGHGDCAPSEVCIFATGSCSPVCNVGGCDEICGPGSVCNLCATSSCPTCQDCVAACRVQEATSCDDDDPCPAGQACDYFVSTCRNSCPNGTECNDLNEFCSPCQSGSCCGCEDCVNLCMPGF
jgi:hypothetical protein